MGNALLHAGHEDRQVPSRTLGEEGPGAAPPPTQIRLRFRQKGRGRPMKRLLSSLILRAIGGKGHLQVGHRV